MDLVFGDGHVLRLLFLEVLHQDKDTHIFLGAELCPMAVKIILEQTKEQHSCMNQLQQTI